MKLVLTLLTRDQADVVDAVVAFHLHAGVDFVIATDHRSEDGTAEILESYERDGVLHLTHEPGEEIRTPEWRTRMARQAEEELGADWVIGCDGDEFWWPRGYSLKEALSAVPEPFGVVQAPLRCFLPRLEGPAFFAERMTVRLSPRAALLDPLCPFKPAVKIAHIAVPDVMVQGGSHRLLAGDLVPLPGWHPIEVLHFPIRSEEQYGRKLEQWRLGGREGPFTLAGPSAAQRFGSLAIDEERLALGLQNGSLAFDTRLRDALRTLRNHDRHPGVAPFRLPSEGGALAFPRPTVEQDRGYATDLAPLTDRFVLRRELQLDDLAARVVARERARF